MDERNIAAFSTIVFVFLVVTIFFSGSFNHPYMADGTRYTVAHEDDEHFEYLENYSDFLLDQTDRNADPIHVSELSASSRAVFQRAKAESSGSFDTETCRSYMAVCDTYHRPDEVHYSGGQVPPKPIYVEDEGGDVWLFWGRELGYSDSLSLSEAVVPDTVSVILRTLALVPVAVVLGSATLSTRSSQFAAVFSLAKYGAVLGFVALCYPYVVMASGYDLYPVLYGVVCLTWLVITGWLVNARRRRKGEPPWGWRALVNNPLVGVQAFLQLCVGAVLFLPIP